MVERCQLAIVGGGPAGLSAAIQAARDGLQVRLFSGEKPGGLVRAAHRLDNLPGFPDGIPGDILADRLVGQTKIFGVSIACETVEHVDHKELFRLRTTGGIIESDCLLLATGTLPARWSMPLPEGNLNRLHRDARGLPPTLEGRRVVVVGGGEAALDAALVAADRGAEVAVWIRGRAPKAPARLVEETEAAGIRLETGLKLVDVKESDEKLHVRLLHGDEESTRDLDHLVLSIGRIPDAKLYTDLTGEMVLPRDIATHIQGLFLAGDLIRRRDRFVATAMGDGQRVARNVLEFLEKKE